MLYDLRVASLLQITSPAYSRPYQVYHSYYLINLAGNGQMKNVYCIRKQKETPFGVSFCFLNQRLPILPGRFQPSTFGVYELNYCVRDGNRWFLVAIITEFVRVFPENYIER